MEQDHRPESRAARFRAQSQHTLELPSGNEVVVKRIGLVNLIQRGVLPDTLTPIVNRMIEETQRSVSPGPTSPTQEVLNNLPIMEQLKVTTDLWDTTLLAMGIDPVFVRAVTDPDTQVAVGDVEADDKKYLFNWANGADADLAAFRLEQVRTLHSASESQSLRPATGDTPQPEPADGGTLGLQPRHGDVVMGDVGGFDAGEGHGQGEAHPYPASITGRPPAPLPTGDGPRLAAS